MPNWNFYYIFTIVVIAAGSIPKGELPLFPHHILDHLS